MATDRHILVRTQWEAIADRLAMSERELEIVRCLFDDRTERQIAEHLGLSPSTVHLALRRLYARLEVRSRTAAVVRVFETYLQLASETSAPLSRR